MSDSETTECVPASSSSQNAGTAFYQSLHAAITIAIAYTILAMFTLISIFLRVFITTPVRVSNVRELIFSYVYTAPTKRSWCAALTRNGSHRRRNLIKRATLTTACLLTVSPLAATRLATTEGSTLHLTSYHITSPTGLAVPVKQKAVLTPVGFHPNCPAGVSFGGVL